MKIKKRIDLNGIDCEGDLDEVIKRLQQTKEQYAHYDTLEIEEVNDFGNYTYLNLYGTRLENDLEEQERLDTQKAWLKLQEQNERIRYEQLKAKFENS